MTAAAETLAEFKNCLGTMSHCRAGWDYELSREQRAEEDKMEKAALARARAIWAENPSHQDDLRAAFKEASPLATMSEIERACPPPLGRPNGSNEDDEDY